MSFAFQIEDEPESPTIVALEDDKLEGCTGIPSDPAEGAAKETRHHGRGLAGYQLMGLTVADDGSIKW